MSIVKGERFRFFGGASEGEVTNASAGSVSYKFDHEPEQVWSMKADDFNRKTYPIT